MASWTFHSLLQGVQGGQYERFDNLMFPEDMERKRLARRGTSRTRSRTAGRRSRSVPVGGDVSSGEEMMERPIKRACKTRAGNGHPRKPGFPNKKRKKRPMSPPKRAKSSKQAGQAVARLFEHDLFRMQCQFMEEDEQMVMDLPMPKSKKEWKLVERCPEAYYVKKIRNTEVNVRKLNSEQLAEFDKAKHVEEQSWVRNAAVRRAGNMVTTERCINMRWVLCYKKSGAPKARIVLIGCQDRC